MKELLGEKLDLIGHNFFTEYYYYLKLLYEGLIDVYYILDIVNLDRDIIDDYLQSQNNTNQFTEEDVLIDGKLNKLLYQLAIAAFKEKISVSRSIFEENINLDALELMIKTDSDESLRKKAIQINKQEIEYLNATTKINFTDYFSVSFPRYKKYTDLDRKHAIYLAPPLMRDKVDNYINNLYINELPEHVIDSLYIVELQKYDTMIDVNGNVIDFSDGLDEYSPIGKTVENKEFSWFNKKITSVNHVVFDDLLDIESSLVYNLLEIRPITDKISLNYLRYYFYYTPPESIFDIKNGEKLLRYIKCRFSEKIDSAFFYSCDLFENVKITIDNFEYHGNLTSEHLSFLNEQSREGGKIAIQAEFGSALYNNLRNLEKRIQNYLTADNLWGNTSDYTGFVLALEEGILTFNNAFEKGKTDISTSSLFGFPLSCEIILRAKLKLNDKNLFVDEKFMFGSLIKYLYKYDKFIFKSGYKDDSFIDLIKKIADKRNLYAHKGNRISINKAKSDIDSFCKAIRMMDELIK